MSEWKPSARPTVGRIVHVRRPGSSVCQAGIVTADMNPRDLTDAIIVAVFSRAGPFGAEPRHVPDVDWVEVYEDGSPAAIESPAMPTWHWPERVGG